MKTQTSPAVAMLVVFVIASAITHGLLALVRSYGATVPAIIPLMYACGVAAAIGAVVLYRKYKVDHNSSYWITMILCAVLSISCFVFPQAI